MLVGAGRLVMRNRGRALLAAAACAFGLVAIAATTHAAASVAGLLKVRLGGDAQATRLVIDLDQAATGKLISDGATDGHLIVMLGNV